MKMLTSRKRHFKLCFVLNPLIFHHLYLFIPIGHIMKQIGLIKLTGEPSVSFLAISVTQLLTILVF